MAFEDIKRNAKSVIESGIKEYLIGQRDKSSYNYIFSKIDLAASVSLISAAETREYIAQIQK